MIHSWKHLLKRLFLNTFYCITPYLHHTAIIFREFARKNDQWICYFADNSYTGQEAPRTLYNLNRMETILTQQERRTSVHWQHSLVRQIGPWWGSKRKARHSSKLALLNSQFRAKNQRVFERLLSAQQKGIRHG